MTGPRQLLIVEDDAKFAATLQKSFERRGYEVVRASDMADMFRMLDRTRPGYAVVDLKLAGESGLACVQALYDAADDDSATGGPDLTRRIFPVISVVTADGYQRMADDAVGGLVETMVEARMRAPGGPQAPLR